METEKLSWKGYEVSTPQGTWVCTKSRSQAVELTADGIDYFLEFSVQNKPFTDIPDIRTLQLRTSEYLVGIDLRFLELVG